MLRRVPSLIGVVTIGVLGAALLCTLHAAAMRHRDELIGGVMFSGAWLLVTLAAIGAYGWVD